MPIHRKPSLADLASGFREVNRSQAELASLVRELEYPAIANRIRSPPIPLSAVLAGLLEALLILVVRLPLHALARVAALLPDPPLTHHPSALGRDLHQLLSAAADTANYVVHWLGILGRVLWIELRILGIVAAAVAFLGLAYLALAMGLVWLVLFALSS